MMVGLDHIKIVIVAYGDDITYVPSQQYSE